MADPGSILVENLREALRLIQRYLFLGLSAAMLTAVLPSRRELGDASVSVTLPGGLPAVPSELASAVAIVVYWVSGALATFTVARAKRIVTELRAYPELLAAALTYPSIPTTRVYGPRIGAALLPPVLMCWAAFRSGDLRLDEGGVGALVLALLPYLVLIGQLWRAIGGGVPDYHGD